MNFKKWLIGAAATVTTASLMSVCAYASDNTDPGKYDITEISYVEENIVTAASVSDGDYTLTQNVTVNGDLYHTKGTLDLNGHTLTVKGTLYLKGGEIYVDGGSLNIGGDLNAHVGVKNSEGKTDYYSGYLHMKNSKDKVTVNGDFNTNYDYSYDYRNEISYKLNGGAIELKGNLNDYYNSSDTVEGLESFGTTFVFSGTGEQRITATDGYIPLSNVEFVNKEKTGTVICDDTRITCHIEKDETVTGDIRVFSMELNGHKFTVNGNLNIRNKLNFDDGSIAGTLKVTGSVTNWGAINVGSGTAYIGGNYEARIPVKNEEGKYDYYGGYIAISSGKATVNGDFNTNYDYSYARYDDIQYKLNGGTIELKGDLNDYRNDGDPDDGLRSFGTTFVFSGTGEQKITATDGRILLSNVEFVNKEKAGTVICDGTRITCHIEKDETVTGDIRVFSMELNGHKFTVNGNLNIRNKLNFDDGSIAGTLKVTGSVTNWGAINVGSGTAYIGGNYEARIPVKNEEGKYDYYGGYIAISSGKATVNGDFNTNYDYSYARYDDIQYKLNGGTIELKGNLNDYYNSYSEYGLVSYGTTFVFSGTGKQVISVKDGSITLREAVFKNKNTQVLCTVDIDVAVPVRIHSFASAWTVDKKANCGVDGSKSHHCTKCDAKGSITKIPATGKHTFGAWKTTKAATYTATGIKTKTCTVCKKTQTATLPKRILEKVTGAKLSGRAADALRINWNKNTNATGYIVEMYQNGKWTRVAKIAKNSTTTYRVSGLKASTVYKFRVRAYKMEGKAAAYGEYSATVTARTNPSVVKGAKLTGRAADALRINWTKNTTADGYIVEMYKGGKWARAAKITKNSTTTYRASGLKASTVYKFRVRAYKVSGKTALYGNYSATVTARTNPSAVKGVKIAGKAKDALRVNWTKNSSAQGYIVEMHKGGKWVKVAKITKNSTNTYRKAGLAKNTTYKFRVKAYYMSGKTALYGNYGSVSGKTAAK